MPSPEEDLNKNKPSRSEKLPQPCGNRDCHASTDMDGNPTFGSGELNDYGYWSNPCEQCARYHEVRFPDEKAWPEKYIEPIKAYKDPNCISLGYGNNVPLDAFQKVHGKALLGILHITSRDLNPYIPRDKDEPFDYKNHGYTCAECRQFHNYRDMSMISGGGLRYSCIHMCKGCLKKYQDSEYEIPNGWYRA